MTVDEPYFVLNNKTESWQQIKEKYTACGLCTVIEYKREVILNEECYHHPYYRFKEPTEERRVIK